MINTVALTGKIIEISDGNTCYVGVIEVNEEQFYVLFDYTNLPDPNKVKDKYVNINGVLQYFKHKRDERDEYTIELGIFVRRLEVYDL